MRYSTISFQLSQLLYRLCLPSAIHYKGAIIQKKIKVKINDFDD